MKNNIQLNIRISDNINQKIDKICKEKNISKADFLRKIIEENCDKILMGKVHDYHTNLLEEILTRTAFNMARIIEGLEQDPNTHLKREDRFRLYGKEVLEYTKNK